ncbi:MAG: DUF6491 family protein [Pseudomonadota bacterium]|nr:DUF6491 family protein [Pseudomonadota bacterium]
MFIKTATGACAAALLAAWAGGASGESPASPVGEEVRSICFSGSINRWRTVKDEPSQLLLDRGANDWYLVEMNGKCADGARQSYSLQIESKPGSNCLRQGDSLSFTDSSIVPQKCRIVRIHRWDETVQSPDDAGKTDDDA